MVVLDPAPDKIRIRFFGTIDLAGPRGTEARLAEQPKILAVVAYLALARPAGFQRRDRLLGLFWPEQTEDRARASLRHALHVIRDALGDASLLRRGDAEIALDHSAVWTDVAAFDEAVAAEEFARALELYRAPLLDGFFAPTSAVEHWLDAERQRVRAGAADAAWVLAQRYEHSSDLTIASRWARRAARLAHADERRVRNVMSLLDRAGDGAGAIAIYEEFRAEITRELALEPSVETRRLADDIRQRRA